jgi:hypothetical protein
LRRWEEEISYAAREAREQRRRNFVLRVEGCRQFKLRVAPPEDLNLLKYPIHDPVFADAAPRVKLKLGLAVSFFIGLAGRENFNHQFRRGRQVSGLVQRFGQSLAADPHDIGDDIVIIGEDDARRVQDRARRIPVVPDIKKPA